MPAAIVTGGARGIGRAIAEALAGAGLDVAVIDRERVDGFVWFEGDVADVKGHASLVERIVVRVGPVNCLVNNAGVTSLTRGDLLREDKRWKYGTPPQGNANFAWVQHFISHLTPTGIAGFVLANGSMSSNSSGEGEIRKAIIEADLPAGSDR